MMDWKPRAMPPGRSGAVLRGRGVSYMRYKQAENYVAMGMEVEVERKSGRVRVTRVVRAHDCGLMINPDAVRRHKGLIANPNCCAIIAITPLWPVHKKYKIRRLIISTYQAASGAGAPAMNELRESTRAFLAGEAYTPKVLPHPYAFNVLNHANFAGPGQVGNSAGNNTIFTRNGAPVTSVPVITQTVGTARQIQFGLRYAF